MTLTFDSARDLASGLRRAAEAHRRHEEEIGHPDPDWPDWYAAYLEREQAGPEHEAGSPAGRSGAAVPVAVVTSRTEAELIAGMLRNNDLRAVVSADDAGGQEPQLQAQGVRVWSHPLTRRRPGNCWTQPNAWRGGRPGPNPPQGSGRVSVLTPTVGGNLASCPR